MWQWLVVLCVFGLQIAHEMAAWLGKGDEAAEWKARFESAARAFNAKFFNKTGSTYYEYGRTATEYLSPQTCIALAVELDLVPADALEDVMRTLVHDVTVLHGGHLNTGIVGVKFLLPALQR